MRVLMLMVFAALLSLAQLPATVHASEIVLSSQCPASFENRAGHCKLVSNYSSYSSLENGGVGGLKTGLPEIRDGFTAQEIDLGRYLFFDPVLSGNGKQSCASCHNPDKGFADGKQFSPGVTGTLTARNVPGLWNIGFFKRYFWDGRANSLEEQMQGPLYSKGEMASSKEKILASLNGNATYRRLFASAYAGSSTITIDQVYRSIAGFESSLISLNSRYDLYAHGFPDALNKQEVEGLNIFRSFVARCAECHTPPLFSNQQIVVIGSPEPDGRAFDPGAGSYSPEPRLRGGFKVPSLRNVALTAPYMHSGRFGTLRETVAFYNGGRGHAVPKDEKLFLHWHIHEPKLRDEELDRLVDFLKTLTDESFKPQRPATVPSGLAVSK